MIFSAGRVYANRRFERRPEMKKATSRDGTALAFDQTGEGPPVILVVGAFNDRSTGAPLAAFLAPRFTVISYDRRGRGASGDTAPYAVEREIEDLEALIGAAGGSAAVFGYSSGAVLALKAAASGLAVAKLALYETPPPQPADHAAALASLVEAGRRGDAVEYFQRRLVGIPEPVIAQLRQAPFRPALEAMAHTLAYEARVMSDGALQSELGAKVRPPTLAIAGGASPAFMREVAEALAGSLPNGRSLTIEGATHDIVPAVLGPVLQRFLAGP
jgi:pimeloyl-ACP methyl ester carboxylesterase